MTTEPVKKLSIVEIAMKKRRLKLYEKISRGDVVTRAELKELKKFEEGGDQPGIIETWKDLQTVFGVSEMTVSRWIKDGMPTSPDGKFCIADIQSWRLTKTDKNGGNKGDKDPAEDWEQRYRKAKALREERLNELEDKKIVLKSEVEAGLVQISIAIKRALLTLPRVLAPRLHGLEPRDIEHTVRVHVEEIINMFAQDKLFANTKEKKVNAHARKARHLDRKRK